MKAKILYDFLVCLGSGMTAKGRLQDLADVQRLIQAYGLNAEFAKELNAYVRDKFVELLS